MDCLRSGLDGAVDSTALDGRDGGAAEPPKKSRPRRESAGFCLAEAVLAFEGGCVLIGGPVLGRAGVSSPKRSICLGAALNEAAVF